MNFQTSQPRPSVRTKVSLVDWLEISIAAPEKIISWSSGEVTSGETIKNQDLKPIPDGLYCEKIFGPFFDHARLIKWEKSWNEPESESHDLDASGAAVTDANESNSETIDSLAIDLDEIKWESMDWECACGVTKGEDKGETICKQCGSYVTAYQPNRKRMGHIELAVPVTHIWFLKKTPSPIGLMLDAKVKDLERVIHFNAYLVIDPRSTPLRSHQVLDQQAYDQACETYGDDGFAAAMGAEAVHAALSRINLANEIKQLQEFADTTKNKQIVQHLSQRLTLFRSFLDKKMRPEWMVLTVLPVLPSGLRPLRPAPPIDRTFQNFFEGKAAPRHPPKIDKFNTPDVNDLYRRVINLNNRLKVTLKRNVAPLQIVRNLKCLLQKNVDALFENGRTDLMVTARLSNRLLKPLGDHLGGKTGRFRQNLLGKRVDYSGRAVITVGPDLKLHQCGLPKKMAVVLFEPFIIHKLKQLGHVKNIAEGKKWIKHQTPEIWEILEAVVHQRLVLLNRAPTLHRLSIQAFEPVLVEGNAIRLHPLVCTGYNADFDGDQMAVHVPVSKEAQKEARRLMLATNNLLSPASGKPIVTPSQDIVLGCFYLTIEPRQPSPTRPNGLPLLGSTAEAIYAFDIGALKTHDRIRLANPDFCKITVFGNPIQKIIETTVGRVVFSDIWPVELGFQNRPIKKSDLSDLIGTCLKHAGQPKTVAALDRLKEVGFRAATQAGISIGIDDMLIPSIKAQAVATAQRQTNGARKQHHDGKVTDAKYKEELRRIWDDCTALVSRAAEDTLESNLGKSTHNSLWLMLSSGARGNKAQVRQLVGLRGLIMKPGGGFDLNPVSSNFREGLSVREYYISTHGARKGMSDTALKTANAGYLTRKLVDVALNVIITEVDCGTSQGRWVQDISQNNQVVVSLAERIVGRTTAVAIPDPRDATKTLVATNCEVDEISARILTEAKVEKVKIRSILDCESKRGVCASCYGRDLSTGRLVELGEAVGIIAAQSIGEPGTQLTMRTFHTGGVATEKGDITGGLTDVENIFEAPHSKQPQVAHLDGIVSLRFSLVGMKQQHELVITNQFTRHRDQHLILDADRVLVAEGDTVCVGQQLTANKFDPHKYFKEVGSQKFQEQMVKNVQAIYCQQGVAIHEKHIEIIARQMLGKVRITEKGDTRFTLGDEVDCSEFLKENAAINGKGGQPAEAASVLLGITQAALRTKSFLSAASFQNTNSILTKAATLSKRDDLMGLKERVMTGGLIPAGTGFRDKGE